MMKLPKCSPRSLSTLWSVLSGARFNPHNSQSAMLFHMCRTDSVWVRPQLTNVVGSFEQQLLVKNSLSSMKDALLEKDEAQVIVLLNEVSQHIERLSDKETLRLLSYMSWIHLLRKDFTRMETYTNLLVDIDQSHLRLKKALGFAYNCIEAGRIEDANRFILGFNERMFEELSFSDKKKETKNALVLFPRLGRSVGEKCDIDSGIKFLQMLDRLKMIGTPNAKINCFQSLVSGILRKGDPESIYRAQTQVFDDLGMVFYKIETFQFFIENDQQEYQNKFMDLCLSARKIKQSTVLIYLEFIYALVSKNHVEMAVTVFQKIKEKHVNKPNALRMCEVAYHHMFHNDTRNIHAIDKVSEILIQQSVENGWQIWAIDGLKACLYRYIKDSHHWRYMLHDILKYIDSLGDQETIVSRTFQECLTVAGVDKEQLNFSILSAMTTPNDTESKYDVCDYDFRST